MRIVSSHTMAEIDRRSQEDFCIPGMILMENAALKAFQRLRDIWETGPVAPPFRDLFFICVVGGGNNAGDALVIARQAMIAGIRNIRVIIRNRKANELAAIHLSIVESLGIPVISWDEDRKSAEETIRSADVIIDGIAGTGMKGALRGTAVEMVRYINEEGSGYVVAVDIPSGLGMDYEAGFPAVKADLTISMGLPKIPLYTPLGRRLCGEIELVNPGFPPQLLEQPDESGLMIVPERESAWSDYLLATADKALYKNSRGDAGVFAGRQGTTGAAVLAAESAARSGAGLVTLYCDHDVYPVLAPQCRSVMVRRIPEEREPASLSTLLTEKHSALLAGPGWGPSGREEVLEELLVSGLPGILDADGIRALKNMRDRKGTDFISKKTAGRWVLTPHPGEFLYLAKGSSADCTKDQLLAGPLAPMRRISADLQTVVVLKSNVVWITAPDGEYAVIDGMNPAMGTGGAGDVLAGIVAGFLARGGKAFEAAVAAATLHQRLGYIAARRKGWFLAEDLPGYISEVLGGTADFEEK